ncbi:hypothetical protein GCM10007879_05250 [Maritalea porphyrae]|uniref:Uncharacterized protein n=1 Tax=Maritalea porphyrae TaxID=880732 RepID=A0ABQ5UML0_9HYPH|nr:hypothetical protein GCM10007879_05250 [Maritalea porphyrae]
MNVFFHLVAPSIQKTKIGQSKGIENLLVAHLMENSWAGSTRLFLKLQVFKAFGEMNLGDCA